MKQARNKLALARADHGRHRSLPAAQRRQRAGDGVVRQHRELPAPATRCTASLSAFEAGLRANDPAIAPSMLYAYAALKLGIPFANGAPNLTVDIPALLELAEAQRVPICGKDFKTGQTLMKTIIAPGLKARMLGLKGWFSTNILGNRDGEVLDEPSSSGPRKRASCRSSTSSCARTCTRSSTATTSTG